MIKNVANQPAVPAQMVNSTTGDWYIGTVLCYVSVDGAIPPTLGQTASGVCTYAGFGKYQYSPTQAETNGAQISFTFASVPHTAAVGVTITYATDTAAVVAAATGTTGTLALTVRSIITDALLEIGVLEPGEGMTAAQGQFGLRRTQAMIDAWAADRLTLSLQLRTSFTWPASTSEVQIGPGQTVNIDRPVWLNAVTYVVPGTSPGVEVPLGIMDEDAYAALTIKSLTSTLPQQCFYQTNLTDAFGTLFVWPQPQSLTLVLYSPQAVGVPATLDSILQGPPGYQDAFLYQLALRLCTPMGVAVPPLLPRMATNAFDTMKRPNVEPGALSIDAALVPGIGAGYNVITDTTTFSR